MKKQDLERDLVISCNILQDDFQRRLNKIILQVLARSMISKIKKDHLVITCKIVDKQDQAKDLVRLSKFDLIQD
jgi:hypothetical protein